jgi:hypothetical protein
LRFHFWIVIMRTQRRVRHVRSSGAVRSGFICTTLIHQSAEGK